MTTEELKEELFSSTDKNLIKQYKKHHAKNPGLYELFEKYSLEAFNSGRGDYSHWAIAQRVRWHTQIETSGCEYKVSNDLIAIYARHVVLRNPGLYGFFRFKVMKKKRTKAGGFY